MKKPILALFLLAAALPIPVPAALVAHWPLDNSAADAAGGGHDGTVTGSTVTFGSAGARPATGTSATFTGTGHIDVPWSAALNPGTQGPDGSGSFTVAFWARPSAVGGAHRSPFTSREENATSVNGPIVYIEPDGTWAYWAGNNGPSGAWNPYKATVATADTWTHVVISYDADTTTRKMFLDGLEVINQTVGISANAARDFHIGSGSDLGTAFNWEGEIDDVGFWDNALTESEIQNVMENGVASGPVIPDPRLQVTTPVVLPLNGTLQQFDLVITNSGLTKNLVLAASSFAGANAANFSVTSIPGPIGPGATGILKIAFNPLGGSGDIEAILNLNSNDPADPIRPVALRGTIYDPQLTAGTQLDFGKLPAGSGPQAASLPIRNDGGGNVLHLDSVNLTGPYAANFSVTSFPATLAPGASGTISVSFDRMGSDGLFSAQLQILSDDLLKPTITVPLKAEVAFVNPLVAWWPLDTDAGDASGNGYHGIVVNSVTFNETGANAATGSSALFDGGGHIDVPYSPNLNPGLSAPGGSGSFTITLWALPMDTDGDYHSAFTAREDNGTSVNGPIIYNTFNGRWEYWAGNNGPSGAWNTLDGGPVIGDTWVHLAISYDADTTTRKMFLDGVEVVNQVFGVSANSVRDLHIGGGGDDGNFFPWIGRLDDVGFFRKALTATEVQQVMTGGVGSLVTPPPAGFAISSLTRSAATGFVTLTWPTTSGINYRVQRSTTLASWLDLNEVLIPGTNSPAAFTDTALPANPTRVYYRVRTVP